MNNVTQGVIKHKMGLLNLAAELGVASCKAMGFSRDTFYRYKSGCGGRWRRGFDRGQPPETQPEAPH